MTVVVAYSPDVYGEAALAAGIEQAQAGGERLVVVNATRGDAYVDRRFAGEDLVADVRRRLADAGLDGEVRQDVVADVSGAVIAAVESEGARLVVVGVKHRSPVGKAIMGSVAQQVILDSPVPVLSVKPAS